MSTTVTRVPRTMRGGMQLNENHLRANENKQYGREFRRGNDVGHRVHFVEVRLVHAAGRCVDGRDVEQDLARGRGVEPRTHVHCIENNVPHVRALILPAPGAAQSQAGTFFVVRDHHALQRLPSILRDEMLSPSGVRMASSTCTSKGSLKRCVTMELTKYSISASSFRPVSGAKRKAMAGTGSNF